MEAYREMIEHLGMECWFLWCYSRTHAEYTTVGQLAAALHWTADVTRIRAERCAERGYPITLAGEEREGAA